MLFFILSIKCTELFFHKVELHPQAQTGDKIKENCDFDIDSILTETYKETNPKYISDLKEIYNELLGSFEPENNKLYNLDNESQMFFYEEKTSKFEEPLKQKLENMNKIFCQIEAKAQNKLFNTPTKTMIIEFDKRELKKITQNRNYLHKKCYPYRNKLLKKTRILLEKIEQIDLIDNTIFNDVLDFIIDIFNFIIPKSHNITITSSPFKLKHLLKLDVWKIKKVSKKINISDLIAALIEYYVYLNKDKDGKMHEIVEDFNNLNLDYVNFCIQKEAIYIRINKIIEIINEKKKFLK
ncbi:uncharacterized protein VNE69_02110 [Vairimorpha necatrix]|uniref:Uncharacterized protein n=1 Tax=Vairimorpha necatrix TaxID=6039 RepID=A0AAX4J9E3_9MICR